MATNIKCIDEEFPDLTIWKYFKTERFLEVLDSSSLYFSSARQFEDKFEGAVAIRESEPNLLPREKLLLDDSQSAFEELRRLTKINCWHVSNYENTAMWSLYAQKNKGLAIVSTPRDIISSIDDYRIKPEYEAETIHFGKVQYVNLETCMGEDDCTRRFFCKHTCFQWENEFRFAISLRLAEEFGAEILENGIQVQINIKQMIKKIVLGPNLCVEDQELILEKLEENDLKSTLQKSVLTFFPSFI